MAQLRYGVKVHLILATACFLLVAQAATISLVAPRVAADDSTDNANVPSADGAQSWFINNLWLITPIAAFIGWVQTWIVAAIIIGKRYGFVADNRYLGLAKRTLMPAQLADATTCRPELVVACAAMDPGVSSQCDSLLTPEIKPASAITWASWGVQLVATTWLVVENSIVWAHNSELPRGVHSFNALCLVLFSRVLACLAVNRGTWALAVLGVLYRPRPLPVLYATTALAVAIEVVFTVRAGLIAGDMARLQRGVHNAGVSELLMTAFAFVFLIQEVIVLMSGFVAAASKDLKEFRPALYWFPAMWLALSPFAVIAVNVVLHFSISWV